MIKAIALDDEPLALDAIRSLTNDFDFICLEKIFTRPSEALSYIEKNEINLIFLDINMPEISGIELAARINKYKIMVVFTTAYDAYAVESYSLNAVDYLMKPISKSRFNQSILKIKEHYDLERFNENGEGSIFIRADFSTIKIELSDIQYIEGMADYLKVYLTNRKPIVTRMTVKGMINLLPENDFLRVHRSFIIPNRRIIAIKSKFIELPEREIPIGNTYLKYISKLSD